MKSNTLFIVKRPFLTVSHIILLCLLAGNLFAATPGSLIETANTTIHTQHVVWNKIPIAFVVPVGQERMLLFPGKVNLHNNNPALTTDKVTILNNDGVLYIRAKKTFSPIRLFITLVKTGDVILVDLQAKPNANDLPIQIILPNKIDSASQSSMTAKQAGSTTINYVTLMRYAIQHLYSPERLIINNPNIYRTPMYTSKSINLVYGDNVMAMPLISWRGDDLYITAMLLQNPWHHNIHLSAKQLRGRWLASSFYPASDLTPQSTLHDRTTVFVISSQPFGQALNQSKEYGL